VKKFAKKGISPVIATILLIAITVVAVGVVMAFVMVLPKPTAPLSAVINIEDAKIGSEKLVISHVSGDPIMAALTNMEVRINGAKQDLTGTTLDDNPDFTVGDRLVLTGLTPLSSDDVIAVVYRPANQILATVTVYLPGLAPAGVWSESTEVTTTNPGDVWFSPLTGTTSASSYSDEVHANSGTSKLGAYQFTITYDESIIAVDTTKGMDGVEAGPDGFFAAVNANTPGTLIVNGFSTAGTGPGSDLHVLTIHWTTVGTGTTTLDLTVTDLTDETGVTIGTPNGISGERTVE